MQNKCVIEVLPVDGKSFRILAGGKQIIELTDEVIFLSSSGIVEEDADDEGMPREERDMDYRHFTLKKFIMGAEFFWAHKSELWRVDIMRDSMDNWEMRFATRKEAIDFQEKILNWLLQK